MALTVYCDLDGTILSIADRYYRIHCELARELGQEPLSKAVYWELRQRRVSSEEILQGWPEWARVPYDERRRQLIEAPAFLQYDGLVPGAKACLEMLAQRYRLVMATLRSDLVALRAQLDRLGLSGPFHSILAGTDWALPAWRAKAQLILKDGQRAGAPAVLVGDTEADVLAGRHLGLGTVAVLSGIRTRSFLSELGPDALLDDITGLPDLLLSWEQHSFNMTERRG